MYIRFSTNHFLFCCIHVFVYKKKRPNNSKFGILRGNVIYFQVKLYYGKLASNWFLPSNMRFTIVLKNSSSQLLNMKDTEEKWKYRKKQTNPKKRNKTTAKKKNK